MKPGSARRIVKARILLQALSLLLFAGLLWKVLAGGTALLDKFLFFFYWDPLLFAVTAIVSRAFLALFLISLIFLAASLLLGRFFCGWLCPFGALQQFASWLGRKRNRFWSKNQLRLFRVKYLLLIASVTGLFFSLNLVGWLDPFSFLTRSLTVFVLPFLNNSLLLLLEAGQKLPLVQSLFARSYQYLKSGALVSSDLHFGGYLLTAALLVAILLTSFYRRRFFCNYLCPLGALYGVAGKFSLLKFKVNDNCTKCGACSKNCPYGGSPFRDYLPSECMTCFNCVADCKFGAIDYRVSFRSGRQEQLPSRRSFLFSVLAGFSLASASVLKPSRKQRFRGYLRPPGARSEAEFLELCLRCETCLRSCPTNALQPALWQAGLEGLWTPVLVPSVGYCEFECNRCTQSCPTKAIQPLSLEEKKEFKIGVAVIDKDLCYTYAEGYDCAVCQEHCPVPEKAIRFKDAEVVNYRGKTVRVRQIYINTLLCIGCGICENVCPRTDAPAIRVVAEQESRELY